MAEKKINYKSPTMQVLMAVLLFVLSAWMVRDKQLGEWEKDLFNTIYGLPNWLHYPFLAVTQIGSIYVLMGLAVAYLIKAHYHIVIRLLMSGTLAYLLAGFAKDLLGRGRPIDFMSDLILRDYMVRGPGFPSGHAAMATAIALTMGHHIPRKYWWVVPLVIVAVSVSRIYLGVHAPMDIVGGFAIGWFSFAIFQLVRLRDLKTGKNGLQKSTRKHKLK